MPEVVKVSTIERHLFGPDAIPWQQLKLPSSLQKLQDRYKFVEVRRGVDAQENVVQLRASDGEFLLDNESIALEQILLEPNALQFQINVASGRSAIFYEDLLRLLGEIDRNRTLSAKREYTRTCQTIVTARLAIPFDALFSGSLLDFLREKVTPKVSLADADAEVILERLRWKVTYKTRSTDFVYAPKELTIEPRSGSDPSEKLYYTQSPTAFETHMEMLEHLEALLGPK